MDRERARLGLKLKVNDIEGQDLKKVVANDKQLTHNMILGVNNLVGARNIAGGHLNEGVFCVQAQKDKNSNDGVGLLATRHESEGEISSVSRVVVFRRRKAVPKRAGKEGDRKQTSSALLLGKWISQLATEQLEDVLVEGSEKLQRIRSSIGFHFCFGVSFEGISGGLAMFLDDSVDLELLSFSKNYIDMLVDEETNKEKWCLASFYGEPNTSLRLLGIWYDNL
ncbi:hypothetical protein COLO4_37474 [Corchorus olitorius]|uniref:Uncharacterized protein n=1 Tax=Corchorus olitorius TaxID=93759 RepID=A0A1R3G1I0_9ROSI|nr:hypothetical protein COLO4_37474 [Corchorus olitorius]